MWLARSEISTAAYGNIMEKSNLFEDLIEGLTENGMEFVPYARTRLFNAAM